MRSVRLIIAFVCLVVVTGFTSSGSEGYKPIKGSYAVSSKNLIDPAPDEKKDRMIFFLEGEAARDMYKSMPGAAKKDDCSEDLMTKASGGLICSKEVEGGVYTCTFGVLFTAGALVKAKVC